MRAALAALEANDSDAAAIEARLAPLLATFRGRFLCLEGGGVSRLLARLKVAAERGETRPSRLLPWCRLLRRCCADEESAVALGLLGGHGVVKRLMGWEVDGEEVGKEEMDAAEAVVECAAEIASRCSLVRGGFPLRCICGLAYVDDSIRKAPRMA